MKIKSKSALTIAILIPVAIGMISALLSGTMIQYSTLKKPPYSPPGYIFPIVWIALYVLMGISSYLIYESNNICKGKALLLYVLQLFFNFLWSIIFFGCSQYLLAFLWLLGLIVVIAAMIYHFFKISPLAAVLQLPYLFWCLFAAYLNFMIILLNM